MIYIFDGYNVMHTRAEGEIRREELEDKRKAFIEDVINYLAATGDRGIIVFDSALSEATECQALPNTSVTVCYSSRLESADLFIAKLVQKQLSATRDRIKVVSADWEVQRGAMQERVERVPPRNFLSSLQKVAEKLAFSPEKDRIRWKFEDQVDVETLRRLEAMRRGKQAG
jgi:predicted RNA-binding protein with PIN domain